MRNSDIISKVKFRNKFSEEFTVQTSVYKDSILSSPTHYISLGHNRILRLADHGNPYILKIYFP